MKYDLDLHIFPEPGDAVVKCRPAEMINSKHYPGISVDLGKGNSHITISMTMEAAISIINDLSKAVDDVKSYEGVFRREVGQ